MDDTPDTLDGILNALADELERALDAVASSAAADRFAEIIERCDAAKALAIRGQALLAE